MENAVDYSVELYYIIIKLNYIVKLNRGCGYETQIITIV
ncbi:hypothetical protein BsLM_0953 [Bacillus sp. LM 4-2]|nr:hypothetical protein BsLM_0953 [Bacillus sp. LM 4-2]